MSAAEARRIDALPTCSMCEMRPVEQFRARYKGVWVLRRRSACAECANAARALGHYWQMIGMPLGADKERRYMKHLRAYPPGVRRTKAA